MFSGLSSVGRHSLYEERCKRSEYAGSRERDRGGNCNVHSSLRGIHAGRGRGDFATSRGVIVGDMVTSCSGRPESLNSG